jgi:hypothetical protein
MRAALERDDVQVVAYNDPFIDPEYAAYMLKVCLASPAPALQLRPRPTLPGPTPTRPHRAPAAPSLPAAV